MKIEIDVTEVVKRMKEEGIHEIEEGYSDTLLDILTELYDLETEVTKELVRQKQQRRKPCK